jgi:Domain of unknown function (DUF3387)/Abortive infection C-terminus
MVEYIKSFIECVCLTIIGEFRAPMPSTSRPSLTELLVAALGPLGLQNTRGVSKLDKVLGGFNKLADALTALRNDDGAVAHGKDAFLDPLDIDTCRAFLHAGDAILAALLNALEGKQPDLTVTREPYGSFPHLDKRIDGVASIEAWVDEDGASPLVVLKVKIGPRDESIEIRAEPSRLLYGIDRSAYVEVLRTVGMGVSEAEEDGEEAVPGAAAPEAAEGAGAGVSVVGGPRTVLVAAYSGTFADLRGGIEAFLASEGVKQVTDPGALTQLVDSLLATSEQNMALDWRQREPIQARLKVACKRVLIQFGIEPKKAEGIAERLVVWLRGQAPEN